MKVWDWSVEPCTQTCRQVTTPDLLWKYFFDGQVCPYFESIIESFVATLKVFDNFLRVGLKIGAQQSRYPSCHQWHWPFRTILNELPLLRMSRKSFASFRRIQLDPSCFCTRTEPWFPVSGFFCFGGFASAGDELWWLDLEGILQQQLCSLSSEWQTCRAQGMWGGSYKNLLKDKAQKAP